MAIVHINSENYDAEVVRSEKPVLLDFFATWCGPCKMLSPIVEEIANEYDQYKICKVDVDEVPELAAKFGVMGVPTLVVMKNGKIMTQSSGARPKAAVLELLKSAD
ncbi:MAG: thioredoxin [Oscillospiraceae bacterium]|nr:thioredoxin [Oscillospiraceae bacterium]